MYGDPNPIDSMADDKPPQITLTIFLIKKDKDNIGSFLPDNKTLDRYTIRMGATPLAIYLSNSHGQNHQVGENSLQTISMQRI